MGQPLAIQYSSYTLLHIPAGRTGDRLICFPSSLAHQSLDSTYLAVYRFHITFQFNVDQFVRQQRGEGL